MRMLLPCSLRGGGSRAMDSPKWAVPGRSPLPSKFPSSTSARRPVPSWRRWLVG